MKITFDPAKRNLTLAARGPDMAEAAEIFATEVVTVEDDRLDYGETRYVTVGYLGGRMVVLIWTFRDAMRRMISLRKANAREQAHYDPPP